MGKRKDNTIDLPTLKARIEKKDIAKNEVAQITKRYLAPCWCGRSAYRLSAAQPEVCSGCNEPVGLCANCKPIQDKKPTLFG